MIRKFKLETIVFTTGACVMILEMVGSRVLAPYLGTSIVVWTSLIGLILGSLSIGYWYGGRLADREPNWRTFAAIIGVAGLYIGMVAIAKGYILYEVQKFSRDIRIGSVISTLILFCPPSVFLGMVSPYAVKLKLKNLSSSGETVGQLYAISTVGSIVGTFLSGFVLIALIGHTKILFLLAVALILTALYAAPKGAIKGLWVAVIFLGLIGANLNSIESIFRAKDIWAIDTNYSHVKVFDSIDPQTGRPARFMKTDPFVIQSGIYLDDPEQADLVFDYAKFLRLVNHFHSDPKKALVVGGAAYTQPRDFLKNNPNSTVDVVEIDPKMTEIARQYFGLTDDPRLTSIHADARTFLNNVDNPYDVIFMDAYHAVYSIPYQLTTKEAVQAIYNALEDDGIVMANLISALTGKKSLFLQKQFATYNSVFPYVQVFRLPLARSTDELQNLILVASKFPINIESDNSSDQELLDLVWSEPITNTGPILTDDFAPVDQYALRYLD
jgi:spermidine synthase